MTYEIYETGEFDENNMHAYCDANRKTDLCKDVASLPTDAEIAAKATAAASQSHR
jgi:hypothetical protein